ncbi:conserved hypothetical protein [Ricinus communis]|uniref:Uncharacterized protein n=1 Tax=Ricinus communis TaxID=3988 RepID=B9RGM2_RICCO|nr:conserved hypothetical protein [Ricinus communis]
MVVWKGIELEYGRNLGLVKSIDLSSKIPRSTQLQNFDWGMLDFVGSRFQKSALEKKMKLKQIIWAEAAKDFGQFVEVYCLTCLLSVLGHGRKLAICKSQIEHSQTAKNALNQRHLSIQ